MGEEVKLRKKDSSGKVVIVSKTKNAETLFGRCERELGRLGITVVETEADNMCFDLGTIAVKNRPAVNTLLTNLMERANRPVSSSSHQMTWFDLKQAAGLIYLAKCGDDDAIKVIGILDPIMEKAREEIGAKMAAETTPKDVEKAKEKGKKMTDSKSGPAKAGAKAKTKKTANLAPSAMSEG